MEGKDGKLKLVETELVMETVLQLRAHVQNKGEGKDYNTLISRNIRIGREK